ncbi:hypothetical protein [Romboutsia sp.]|uniref:hypothetical protein n=1 Tax=Romboutsia sp. TaxID=1965302 RepID=UPI003F329B2C
MMKLDVKKIRKEKNTVIVSSKESLKDIEHIQWSKDIIAGSKKVEIKATNR